MSEPLAAGFPARAEKSKFWFGQFDALELCAVEELATVIETSFIVGLDFATIISSPVPSFLCPCRHSLRQLAELNLLMIPFITSETAFRRNVGELVLGIDVCDWDFLVRVDSVKQPIKRNSVGLGHMSHCWTSAFDDHLDHRFILFKHVKHGARTIRFRVGGNIIDIG